MRSISGFCVNYGVSVLSGNGWIYERVKALRAGNDKNTASNCFLLRHSIEAYCLIAKLLNIEMSAETQ